MDGRITRVELYIFGCVTPEGSLQPYTVPLIHFLIMEGWEFDSCGVVSTPLVDNIVG